MSEWLKTLLSVGAGTILGLVSAFILEPIKIKHLRRLDARRAEASLYDELGRALTIFRIFSLQDDRRCQPLVEKIKFEKFDYYFGQRREVFYEISENVGIRSLYGQFELILQKGRAGKSKPVATVKELANAVEYSIKLREVDGARIEFISREHDEESRNKGMALEEFLREPD
jgi:hypothetical protein